MFLRAQQFCETHAHTLGNTCLHVEVARGTLFSVQLFLSTVPEETAAEMAKIVNDEGLLPFDLIDSNLPAIQRQALRNLLIPLMLPNIKSLNEPINFADIVSRYKLVDGTLLYEKCRIACKAMNAVRKKMKLSPSHPQTNALSLNEKIRIRQTLKNQRKKAETKLNDLICSGKDNHYEIPRFKSNGIEISYHFSPANYKRALKECVVKSRVGNCCEMSYSTAKKMKKLTKSSRFRNLFDVYPFSIDNGDHAFVMTGTSPTDIGDEDIMCDSWTGNIAVFRDRDRILGDCRQLLIDGNRYNILTSFNPKYHVISFTFLAMLRNTHFIDLRNPSYVTDYFRHLAQSAAFSSQEYLIFFTLIKPKLKEAIRLGLVKLDELQQLKNPVQTLKAIFFAKHGLDLLKGGRVSIIEVETKLLPKARPSKRGLFAPGNPAPTAFPGLPGRRFGF